MTAQASSPLGRPAVVGALAVSAVSAASVVSAASASFGASAVSAAAAGSGESAVRRGAPRSDGVPVEEFRRLFRRHAAGVTVVTLDGPAGPVGFTATSVSSISAEPPLVSLAVAATSSSSPALLAADSLLVHFLGAAQQETAARFSTSGVDRFAAPSVWCKLPTGEPLLTDAPAWLRGRIEYRLPVGDHYLVVARVLRTHVATEDAPLVYHDGQYGMLLSPPT